MREQEGRAVLKVNIFLKVSTLMGNDSFEKVRLGLKALWGILIGNVYILV